MLLVLTFKDSTVKKLSNAVNWTVKEDKCDSFFAKDKDERIIFMCHWSDVKTIELLPEEVVNDVNAAIYNKYN